MTETGDRMRIVVYYAIWATICAAIAGIAVALIHTWFFSFNPGKAAVLKNLFDGAVTALGIAAGQGAVALATGSVLARLGRTLQYTVLLGLVIGVFDFAMYFLQMAVPATELGWVPDIIVLAAVAGLITTVGARRSTVSAV